MQADSNVVPKRMLVHCADIYRCVLGIRYCVGSHELDVFIDVGAYHIRIRQSRTHARALRRYLSVRIRY